LDGGIDTTFTDAVTADSVILEGGNVIYFRKHDSDPGGKPGKQIEVIAHLDKDGDNISDQYVYINDNKLIRHAGDDKFDFVVSDDTFDNDLDNTKYVFAKDGITVSIEGKDEAKVKEMAAEIEKKLGVNDEESVPAGKKVEKEVIKKK
jgi:hypothetical protein